MTSDDAAIDELTAAIRAEAVDRRADDDVAAVEREVERLGERFGRQSFTERASRLKSIVGQTQRLGFINPNVPMVGRRPYLAPVKRVIQAGVRWYVGAIVGQIQEYIRADLHALRVAADALDALERRVRELESRIEKLESRSGSD